MYIEQTHHREAQPLDFDHRNFDLNRDSFAIMDHFTFNPDSVVLTGSKDQLEGQTLHKQPVENMRIKESGAVGEGPLVYKIMSGNEVVALTLGSQKADQVIDHFKNQNVLIQN
jgi:hypothetical protein